AVAGVARASANLDDALAHFRHFQLEQLHHEFRRCTRHEQLRAARLGANFDQETAHAVTHAHHFARNGLVARNERLSLAAEIEVDVAALDALGHAIDQFAHAILERIDHLLALGLADALHDHLLGGLRGDAPEFGILDRLFDVLAHLCTRALVL